MIRSKITPLLTAVAATALLAACAVGPKAPDAPLPPSASSAFVSTPIGTANGAVQTAEARDDWWRLYDDPVLDSLIEQAFAENNELEAAIANVRSVRATLSETRGGRLPTLSATASGTYSRQSAGSIPPGQGPGGTQEELETYDVGLETSYEVDLFGRVSAAIRAARADAEAAEAAMRTVQIIVAAETARAYADACSANAQIAVAERTISLQGRTADLTQRLLDGGAGSGLDVARAQSQLASTRAQLPTLRAQRDGALFRLATLTGRTPAEASEAARACTRPPQLSQPIPVGDGAALLARRPDVHEAERRLIAAAARVNVAVANLYPRITLGGSLGATALDIGDLGDEDNFRFSLGPLLTWSYTNPGVAQGRVNRAEANTDVALATFDQTVLLALQETETALTNYANELDRRSALTEARDQAAEAARLARLRFDAGADSFLSVLDAERTEAAAEATLAQSEALVTTYQIALFKALAGGWEA
ncbi:efflux transporter outer membrane subunit [Brevundimonas bacteroides]|uniref:efflux transporter outer membrane subunit n=1 Tax=Brevundimonas bacteroides TaxID=74311 RepID=UPI00049804DF|nr:efflux transporter outer membrane subunit [Brevundimonas bacteroides]